MLRAGRTPDGTWYLGRGDGRGVWWCDEVECESALRIAQLARALRTSLGERDFADFRSLRTGSGFKSS
ncbi:MAG: hypothetical protein HKL86_04575 [Acidimicrobiaceae bacterium]|nr:hypothetical protein [Acidimicrobiaceae bacterium]